MTNKQTALEEFIFWFDTVGRFKPPHEVIYQAIKLLPKEYDQLKFAFDYNVIEQPSFDNMLEKLP